MRGLDKHFNANGKTFDCCFDRGYDVDTWRVSVFLDPQGGIKLGGEDEGYAALPRNGFTIVITILAEDNKGPS
jgi:hypothetical protein